MRKGEDMFIWDKAGKIQMTFSIALRPKLWKLVYVLCVLPDVVYFTVLASARPDRAKVQRWVYLHFKWKHTLASVVFCP
jgi:hypothetical protein